ncbi:MAG: 2-amino-4-hydroxy-6-hydroxymethyldihydropteridine diphosphokinase [Verrucomicrobiales bacterium]
MEIAIALGSNLGDRLRNLRSAVDALLPHLVAGSRIEKSPVYQTDPVDCPPEAAPFYNAVIIVDFAGSVVEMLNIVQEIERQGGRPGVSDRAINAPRPIDLDLLYAGDLMLDMEQLILPHPRLHLRRFVLVPLVHLRPDRILPGYSIPLKAVLDSLQSDEPPLDWVTDDW